MTSADCDVVVVGAGLAGLRAAAILVAAGLEVTVLDAADGVGGRVRTDVVDGLRLDRGFQVYNTAYPAGAATFDHRRLRLRPFLAGALVARGGRRHLVADPRRHPRHLPATLRFPVGGPLDKLRLGARSARLALGPAAGLLDRPEVTARRRLGEWGLSDDMIDGFVRPFLSGVFCETDLETSSRFFELVWRSFARGTLAVPAEGMQALPEQLADRLGPARLRLRFAVECLEGTTACGDGGRVSGRALVVATDGVAAAGLLGGLVEAPATNGCTTTWHLAPEAPTALPVILVDGDASGPVVNSVVMSNVAPTYAGGGRVLVASTTVGRRPPDQADVSAHLARLWGCRSDRWETVAVHHLPDALPSQRPPLGRLRRSVRAGEGRYVCGDHRDSASIQGALVSGRRAAAAVLADLGAVPGDRPAAGLYDREP